MPAALSSIYLPTSLSLTARSSEIVYMWPVAQLQTGGAMGAGPLNIVNSILWGNTADLWPEYPQLYEDVPGSSTVVNCDIDQDEYEGADGNIRLDPIFVDVTDPDPANWDLHIDALSPCIDTGTSEGAPYDDMDGDSRPQGLGYDIGADEYVFNIPDIINFFDDSVDNGNLEGNGSGNLAEKRLNAFRKMLVKAGDRIDSGKINSACNKLYVIYKKCDGEPKPKDLAAGPAAANLADMINNLMISIECD